VQRTVTAQRISWFNQQRQLKLLDLKPTYQRNPVWPTASRTYLIDTILKNLPMPKVFIHVETDEAGESAYSVVDGQQRLKSIFEFIDGKLTLPADYSPTGRPLDFEDLSATERKAFFDYDVTVEELRNSTDAEIRDMFRRLNKNVAKLTPQELRHAQYAGRPFYRFLEDLADATFWKDVGFFSAADSRRMGDVEFVSQLLFALNKGPLDGKATALDALYRESDETPPDPKAKRDFNATLSLVRKLVPDIQATRFAKAADFYGLFTALAELRREYAMGDEQSCVRVLHDLSQTVDLAASDPTSPKLPPHALAYYRTVIEGPNKVAKRRQRVEIIEDVLIPYLNRKDKKRLFTDVEKRIIWSRDASHTCVWCNKPVRSFQDYQPDHQQPWSKGGPTSLDNAAIFHASCNQAAKDKAQPRATTGSSSQSTRQGTS
jgi:5-methylcytosine-specific restriction endonuclease McrA